MSDCRDASSALHRVAQYREASATDVEAIASLHADSWRRHYRGAYLDSFLDGDVVADRVAVWSERLIAPRVDQYTLVAEINAEVVGFVHMILDHDPEWGTLLDNLHVSGQLKRQGIGSRLLSEGARGLVYRRPSGTFHLWVLDQNASAQSFYRARGGIRVESTIRGPFPGGGTAPGHRYFWSDPRRLL